MAQSNTPTTRIRYGARSAEERRSREIEATSAEIWSTAITAVYETDPELVAAVLPRPLEPGPEPLVRITITAVQMPVGPAFGAGWIGVQARHGDVLGEYPIFMPMTTEQSVVGGRDTYGEPKKIAEVRATRDGDRIEGVIARMGFTICEVRGRINETREPYEKRKTDFWFKCSPSAERGGALDQDPLLVYGEKTEKARVHEGIDGELILKDSPLDPVADLVVRNVVDINWTERATIQVGRIIGPVPREHLEPFLHQRYDDLSVLGSKD
ncbi:MAG TPA: acetoacetate decarboxylase family protein [Acidimicrobiia bacterium]|jgi:acetoacetate decarboxylase